MRAHIHTPKHLGDTVSDAIAKAASSWYCVGLHVTWFVAWFAFHLDINLLTLIVSLEAIFLCLIIMMSQDRQSGKDRLRDDHEAQTVDLMAADHKLLMQINRQQLEILERLP